MYPQLEYIDNSKRYRLCCIYVIIEVGSRYRTTSNNRFTLRVMFNILIMIL